MVTMMTMTTITIVGMVGERSALKLQKTKIPIERHHMRVRIEMIARERRPVSEFILGDDEPLASRVKEEIEIGIERGDISPFGLEETLPPISVFHVDEHGEMADHSFALFKPDGTELTGRGFEVEYNAEIDSRFCYQLVSSDLVSTGRADRGTLGIFDNELTARKIGALWRAGAFD